MADGIGCMCAARSSADCGCPDVDWTPQRIYDLQGEVVFLSSVIRETFWMARRYAHGRHTYAPAIIREKYKILKKHYPNVLPKKDKTIKPIAGLSVPGDSLEDCNE